MCDPIFIFLLFKHMLNGALEYDHFHIASKVVIVKKEGEILFEHSDVYGCVDRVFLYDCHFLLFK